MAVFIFQELILKLCWWLWPLPLVLKWLIFKQSPLQGRRLGQNPLPLPRSVGLFLCWLRVAVKAGAEVKALLQLDSQPEAEEAVAAESLGQYSVLVALEQPTAWLSALEGVLRVVVLALQGRQALAAVTEEPLRSLTAIVPQTLGLEALAEGAMFQEQPPVRAVQQEAFLHRQAVQQARLAAQANQERQSVVMATHLSWTKAQYQLQQAVVLVVLAVVALLETRHNLTAGQAEHRKIQAMVARRVQLVGVLRRHQQIKRAYRNTADQGVAVVGVVMLLTRLEAMEPQVQSGVLVGVAVAVVNVTQQQTLVTVVTAALVVKAQLG
jgi:hypothetical protein